MSTLKEFCKNNNMSYRQRRQGGRFYVTVATRDCEKEDWFRNWNFLYNNIVTRFYPDARMTSGSKWGATFFVGDVIGMLKENNARN